MLTSLEFVLMAHHLIETGYQVITYEEVDEYLKMKGY